MTTIPTFESRIRLANMERTLDNYGALLETLDTKSDLMFEQGFKQEGVEMVDQYNELNKRYKQLKREFNKMSAVSYDNLKW